MIEGEIDGNPYPIAIGRDGNTLWDIVSVGRDLEETWENWDMGMGEDKREHGRGYLYSQGFDASQKNVLRLAPFYHEANLTTLSRNHGYLMDATGGAQNVAVVTSGQTSAASTTSKTLTYTVAAGTSRLLLVAIIFDGATVIQDFLGTSVTWEGQDMGFPLSYTVGSGPNIFLYALLAPIVKSSGTITVSLFNTHNIIIQAINWTGVNQEGGSSTYSDVKQDSGTSTSSTLSAVTTGSSEFIYSVIGVDTDVSGSLAEAANQTEAGTPINQGSNVTSSDSIQDSDVDTSATWAWTGSLAYKHTAVSLLPENDSIVFIADGATIYKYTYDPDGGLTADGTTAVANGVAGRPAMYEGKWYVPFGTNAVAQRLDDASASGGDWNTAGSPPTWKASHLSLYQQGITPKLARAETASDNGTNQVSLATSLTGGGDWADNTQVGDTTTAITDLVELEGLLFVAKEDNLYDFGVESESRSLIQSLPRGVVDSENGKGTAVFFDMILYPTKFGLWRYQIGRGAIPIGLSSLRALRRVPNLNPPKDRRPTFVSVVGEWVYVTFSDDVNSLLVAMRPRREGDPSGHEWIMHGLLDLPLSKGHLIDNRGRLWLKGASSDEGNRNVRVIVLGEDGSPDVFLRRGQASGLHRIIMSETDFGLPFDLKQFRYFAIELENWDSNATLRTRVARDSAAEANVGSAITSSGVTVNNWTVGTDDTAYRVRPILQVETNSSYTPKESDPRGLRVRIKARKAERHRIVIPADDGILKDYGLTAEDVIQNLRRLQDQGPVTNRQPGSINTFSGEVTQVTNTVYKDSSDKNAYGIQVEISRFATD